MIKISSSAFNQGGAIPEKFTCKGQNISPPLAIGSMPMGTKSLVLILQDPDAAAEGGYIHWILFNIPAQTSEFRESKIPPDATQGNNSAGKANYAGPCPHSGTHHYYFKIYALDVMLNLPQGASLQEVEQAIQGHILDEGQLMGTFGE